MGYFSELAMDYTYREDHSYPSPEWQLRERINDLMDRLKCIIGDTQITIGNANEGCCFAREDVEYALPECLFKSSDIILAIALAKRKLAKLESENENIVEVQCCEDSLDADLEIPGQLSIWDSIPLTIPKKSAFEIVQAA